MSDDALRSPTFARRRRTLHMPSRDPVATRADGYFGEGGVGDCCIIPPGRICPPCPDIIGQFAVPPCVACPPDIMGQLVIIAPGI
jgi:hypothetical protein